VPEPLELRLAVARDDHQQALKRLALLHGHAAGLPEIRQALSNAQALCS